MLTSLSLRLRIFLFFLFIAVVGIGLVGASLLIGFSRLDPEAPGAAFIFAGLLSAFGLLGLVAGVWLLFDENVAKPIERLAAAMRTRAHAGVDVKLKEDEAKYLGDLAPATQAVTGQLTQSTMDAADAVAAETARLATEKDRLTALLTEIPIAMILVSPSHQIVLYDGQAAEVLRQIHTPRLNASIFDFFREQELLEAHAKLKETGAEVSFRAHGTKGKLAFDARLKPLSGAPGYMLLVDDTQAVIPASHARPLIYDFDLMDQALPRTVEDQPIAQMNFVVFDTETTGLLPHKDEIVQIGAVRVVNCRIVPGEVMDQLVDPGRPIPPASTKVHHVTDEMVKGAPDPVAACAMFHEFASGAVIVAHNAPFDLAFMKRHGASAGLNWDHPVLDTVLLSAVLFGASETHTLDAVCDRLGITIPDVLRHTALGDAQATAEVLCKLLPMLTSRGFTTFGEVIAQTRQHGRLLQDMN
ncbi:3'-5' exonuclease [Roseovarius faecimaris]|uniref:DNA-directed DNA polymerase n=1 Tax=Roseovarius faecimaris TaxID=2494550 RepID=A0A6I6IWU2_9RHOB|nr:exonuclease domain-containing protein [Roseovarius faecimaris]QGX99887.1 3'-5' exonuclease [Roseovarius faecimaris]